MGADMKHWRFGPVDYMRAGIVSRLSIGPIIIDRIAGIERAYWAPGRCAPMLRGCLALINALLAAGILGWVISERMLAASL